MITNLAISNYRSLGESAELRLRPLTALVGPNGSGKSNIVDALRFLSEAVRNGLEAAIAKRHGITTLRRWSGGRPFNIIISVTFKERDGASGTYVVELGAAKEAYRVKREYAKCSSSLDPEWADNGVLAPEEYEIREGKWCSGPSGLRPKIDPMSLTLPLIAANDRFRALADAIRNIAIYSIFPDTLRRPQTYDPTRPMDEHGTNWCSILKDARREGWVGELRAALGQITGDIDDIRMTTAGGFLIPEFRHGVTSQKGKARERWFAAAQESDGTLRMAGIITALLQEPPLTLIGIEEPELTVHPGALPMLYDFLVQASQRSQVLITTHSPDLLGLLKADEVRVVERHDGVTTVGRMDESQRAAVQERLFTPGELMRWEGLRQEPAGNGRIAESPLK
ncbi:MAG: AAA family ATPase [Isosphaeraceae bacterium]